jgi:hypothetical protein
MYTKKILSAATAVAIMSTGVMAFDMIAHTSDANASITTDIKSPKAASYTFGANSKEANAAMVLSDNDKGDALIYPAFKSGEDWVTEISVRNTRDVSVIAKAVLYDATDSHELKDFNIYLSSHDVARFKIKGNTVTTRDGSIMAGIDQTLKTNQHQLVAHEAPETTGSGLGTQLDADGDFLIAEFDNNNGKIDSGYVVIYVMTQTDANTTAGAISRDIYHGQHDKLYNDYYAAMTSCRGANWKSVFKKHGSSVNGTAINHSLLAPNVNTTCDTRSDGTPLYFNAPDKNIIFGEVSISKVGTDPRNLLLKARAIENYTDDGQMMLWAPGEYASIQDRRIIADSNGDGLADYNTVGIADDAKDMVTHTGHFVFNAQKEEKDRSVLLLTQPMKRALVMAGHGDDYWTKIDVSADQWGLFSLDMQFYNEDENADIEGLKLVTITSPSNAEDEVLYKPEMAPLPYEVLASGASNDMFIDNKTNGYADVSINPSKGGLPAIVTEMISEDIGGQAQINWIYSTINNN